MIHNKIVNKFTDIATQIKSDFALSFKENPQLEAVIDEFLIKAKDFVGSAPPSGLMRFFPMFLKSAQLSPPVYQLAQYEFLLTEVVNKNVLTCRQQGVGVQLNQTLETVYISADCLRISLHKGLYAIFKTFPDSVCVLRLSRPQAMIIDLLKEDLSWSFDSLKKAAQDLNPEIDWSQELQRLLHLHLIHNVA